MPICHYVQSRAHRVRPWLDRLTDDNLVVILYVMKEIGAAELRQSLGRLAKRLERDGQPILLKVGSRPVGVIVSVKDYNERFALQKASEERARLVEEIVAERKPGALPVDDVLDELRGR